mgnify:CR=1 FL=1
MTIRFDGRVAIVTGAGNGLGKMHALGLAKRGAKVVVNDLGGPRDGSGKDATMAQKVAEAINKDGGKAIANGSDISTMEGGEQLFNDAIKAFGKVDILVNNVGGTLWAKPYQHYAEDEIEAELRRSLLPTLWCCRAALPAMLGQGSGAPGTILEASRDGLLVACGEGALRLTRLQLPGGKPLAFADLYNSRREQFAAGQVLGQ